jgi:hypothetical protein
MRSMAIVCMLSLATLSIPTQAQTDFYVDATNGNNGWLGTLPYPQGANGPWKDISKFSSITLQAGDKVYLKRGERWQQQTLRVFGNGSAGNEIVVDAYGDPDLPLPVIDGSSYLGRANEPAGNVGWQVYREPAEVLPPSDPNALRFQSGWEAGGEFTDNGAWSGPFGSGNVLSLSSSSSAGQDDRFGTISGARSLRVSKNGTASAYVESRVIDTGASGELFLRFTFRHIGRQVSDNDYNNGHGFIILQLIGQNDTVVAEIGFQRGSAHQLYFHCSGGGDVGSWAEPTFDGRPHVVELHYVPGGSSELRFDGRFSSNTSSNLNKFVSGCAAQANKIRVGLMNGAVTLMKLQPSGQDVFWIDDVAVGPASYGWLKSPSRIYTTQSPLQDAASNATKRYGQIWDVAAGESLNNGDGKKTGDLANMGLNKMDENYLLENEFEISQAGQIFVTTRGGISPVDSSHLMPVRRYGVNILGSYIVIRNLRVEYQWENGVLVNKLSHHVTIEDSEMRRAVRMGIRILRPTNDIVVSNNKVWEIGGLSVSDGAGFCIHAGSGYQFGGDTTPIKRIRMTDNVVWGCGAWTDNDCCEHVPAQGYGLEVDTATVGVDIQRNMVMQPIGSRSWWEVYRHATNGIHLEQFDHLEQTDVGEDIAIRNNLILDYPAGIVLNKFNTAVNVDNNTIVLPKSGYGVLYAIHMSSDDPARTSGRFGDTMNVAMRNNLFYSRPDDVRDLRSIYHPAKTDAETLTIWNTRKFSSSHNLAYHPTSSIAATLFDTRYASYPNDWLYWSGIAGENDSIYPSVDPMLSASADYGLQPGSPALNSGIDVGMGYSGTAPDIGYLEGEMVEIPDYAMEMTGITSWRAASAVIAKSASTVRRGLQSLRVEGLIAGNGNRAEAAPMAVVAGEQYRISAWVYATESVYINGISGIAVRDLTKNSYLVAPFTVGAFAVTPHKWTYLEMTFTVPQGTSSIGIWLMNRSLSKPAYFDDVRLMRLMSAPP